MKLGKWLTAALFFIGGLWAFGFVVALAVRCCGDVEKLGQMGDSFNMLNTLFAGLAFTVIAAQLWMQRTQIEEEKEARYRAERISALATRIQVNFDKIIYERKLLLAVAPSFKNVSFLHEGDGQRLEASIDTSAGLIVSLREAIDAQRKYPTWENASKHIHSDLKQLWDNSAALPMMKQIKKWVDQLEAYENEMDRLLREAEATGNDADLEKDCER